jgi:hypothetical protein
MACVIAHEKKSDSDILTILDPEPGDSISISIGLGVLKIGEDREFFQHKDMQLIILSHLMVETVTTSFSEKDFTVAIKLQHPNFRFDSRKEIYKFNCNLAPKEYIKVEFC